jgi:hypothetical protein
VFRFLSWFLSVFGHYLLFSPIIKLMAIIPLVGYFLSSILAFAAILFSLVWATALHFLIMGLSWLVYRPLYGILCLTVVGCSIALM